MNNIQNNTNNNTKANWVDVVWYLSDTKYLTEERLEELKATFNSVIVATPEHTPLMTTQKVIWHQYEAEKPKASVWNAMLNKGANAWKMFLQDDEFLRVPNLDASIANNTKEWPATLIIHRGSEKNYQYYQMRLVHNFEGFTFDGVNLPDATRSIINNDISLSNVPVEIIATRNPNAELDIEEELSVANNAPQLFIENGYRLFKAKKYIHAAAQYRQLANSDMVLPFDRLSALNGIASCHAEMFRWDQALVAADHSIAEDSFQNLPYLIKFKVSQLNKEWEEAYMSLKKYYENTFYERIKLHSRANYDVRITIDETLISLVDLAFKAGYLEEASEHLEELFDLKEGNLEDKLVQQLLVLSIELEDFEKSEFYFKKLFAGKFPKNLTEKETNQLNDYMEMFIKQGWYETVYEVYSELHYHYPQNDEFRRRLIVTLVKTGRLEQARNLASKVA